jgi:hypothetical protein
VIIAADRDTSSVHNSMMKAAERNEIFDVVVTADRAMVAVVQLNNGRSASGPGACAIASMHRSTKVRGDRGGASTEMEGVTVVVFKHGLQPGVASEPTGGTASKHNTCRLKHIGSSGIDARERCWVQQRVDGNMNDDLRGKTRCLKFARNEPVCEFAHT